MNSLKSNTILYCSILFILSVLFSFSEITDAHAQGKKNIVYGNVVDKKSGEPLAGTNVYLSNTTLGASTDQNGTYEIRNIPGGVYDLTFSFIGFKPVIKRLVFDGSKTKIEVNVSLEETQASMDELVVESDRPGEWAHLKDIFIKEFFGYSVNVKDMRILNPEFLDFNLDGKHFTATASQPIIVENHSLGYKMYIELDRFNWNISTNTGNMVFYPKFEELVTEDKKTRKKWNKQRSTTYEGSMKHFFTALYEERAEREGFVFNRGLVKEISGSEKEFELAVRKDLPKKLKNLLKGYRIPKQVEIKFSKYHQSSSSVYSSNTTYTVSYLTPNDKNSIFFIDPWGNLLDPNSVLVGGEWASERVADYLPFHYTDD